MACERKKKSPNYSFDIATLLVQGTEKEFPMTTTPDLAWNLRLTESKLLALTKAAGKYLFEEMEKLDPSFDTVWDDLPDRERAFFEHTIENVLIRLFTRRE